MSPTRTWFEHTGSRHTYKVKGAEIYVVSAEVKTIGDTPLLEHPVRILDPDTGEAVGKDHKTDDKGVVRAEVPKKKDYRIEIVDEEIEIEEPPRPRPEPPPAILVCEFVDAAGKPLANTDIELKSEGGGGGKIPTDEHGRLHTSAALGPCELTVQDQTFVAHSLPMHDSEEAANLYRFVLEKKKS